MNSKSWFFVIFCNFLFFAILKRNNKLENRWFDQEWSSIIYDNFELFVYWNTDFWLANDYLHIPNIDYLISDTRTLRIQYEYTQKQCVGVAVEG